MYIAKLIQYFEIQIPHKVKLPDKPQDGVDDSQSPLSALFIPRRCLSQLNKI